MRRNLDNFTAASFAENIAKIILLKKIDELDILKNNITFNEVNISKYTDLCKDTKYRLNIYKALVGLNKNVTCADISNIVHESVNMQEYVLGHLKRLKLFKELQKHFHYDVVYVPELNCYDEDFDDEGLDILDKMGNVEIEEVSYENADLKGYELWVDPEESCAREITFKHESLEEFIRNYKGNIFDDKDFMYMAENIIKIENSCGDTAISFLAKDLSGLIILTHDLQFMDAEFISRLYDFISYCEEQNKKRIEAA